MRKLAKLGNARRLWGLWGWARQLAYLFDWVNGYISWDTTIWRTGYDLNVAGNVTTGSDSDGSYMSFTITPAAYLSSWTAIPSVSISSAFTVSLKTKTGSDVTTTQRIFNCVTSSSNRVSVSIVAWELRVGIYNWTSYVGKKSKSVSANTLYVIHYTRDWSTTGKLFVAAVEETTVPASDPTATATTWTWLWGAPSNYFLWFIYYCACWSRALNSSEIATDYALWNTTKTDPTIVAYYVPENLQYNTQYLSDPKALDTANRSKGSWVTVTADTTVAPDGTTTADTVAFSWWWLWSNLTQLMTTLSWSQLASKTFVVKAFVKCSSWTQSFRIRCQHQWVSDYLSSDQTATTTRQEFTFTQAFTSSTSWTWVNAGIIQWSWAAAYTVQVWNVRLFLTNETLRDESPNIGGYIGWKSNKVFSCRYKPNADFASSASAWVLLIAPRWYIQDRNSNHTLQIVVDRRPSTAISQSILWSSYRGMTHVIWCFFWNWSWRSTKLYVNWSLVDSDSYSLDAPSANYVTTAQLATKSSTYYSWYIRKPTLYIWTIDDADAANIFAWWEPATAVKYLQWKPLSTETGKAVDRSGNGRTGTLTGGVTRVAKPAS